MKAYINNSLYNNNKIPMYKQKTRTSSELKNKTTRENMEIDRPARAISFGGSVNLAKGAKKGINALVEFVNENEAAYTAIYSILIAGLLKPLVVLYMPGSEEKDKQVVAVKNFLQAFLGGFLGLIVGGGFIKKAIDIVVNNTDLIDNDALFKNNKIKPIDSASEKALELAKKVLQKEKSSFGYKFKSASEATKNISGLDKIKEFTKAYKNTDTSVSIDEIAKKASKMVNNFVDNHKGAFEKNIDFVKAIKSQAGNKVSYEEAFKTFWKNSTGALTSIGKAKISSIFLPGFLAFLFAKKNFEKEQMQTNGAMLCNNSTFKTEQEQFKKMMNKNAQPAFKGSILNSAIDGCASVIEKAGMSKAGEKLTKVVSKWEKPSARMADLESIAITIYWLQNTARSKKIDPSLKLGFNLNTALVTIVSSTAAFFIDKLFDGWLEKSKGKYAQKLSEIAKDVKEQHTDLLKNRKSFDIANATPAIKMAIKDKVTSLLETKKEISSEDIVSLIDDLKATQTFKNAPSGFVLDKNLIEKVIDNIKQTEPIKQTIKEASSNLLGSKEILKELSNADLLNEDAVKSSIKKLSGVYGKKLSKFKSLTIFTLVVRFIVPVLMVPISGELKKKIVELTTRKKQQENIVKK